MLLPNKQKNAILNFTFLTALSEVFFFHKEQNAPQCNSSTPAPLQGDSPLLWLACLSFFPGFQYSGHGLHVKIHMNRTSRAQNRGTVQRKKEIRSIVSLWTVFLIMSD